MAAAPDITALETGIREVREERGIEELRWQTFHGVENVGDLSPLARWHAMPAVRAAEN